MMTLAGVIVACDSASGLPADKSAVITKDAVQLPPEGGRESVELTSPMDWSVTTNASWIQFDPPRGSAGTVLLTVSADKNDTGEARSALLHIIVGDAASLQLRVSQEPYTETPPGPGPDDKSDPIEGAGGDVDDWEDGGEQDYERDNN